MSASHFTQEDIFHLPFFVSSLIGQCLQLEGIHAFGTDGEQPLIDAFRHELGFSQHLTCFIHVRRNIKEKLSNCNVPSDVAKLVLDNIFGHRLGTVLEEGLVDSSDNDDFQVKLESLLHKWRNLSIPSSADMERSSGSWTTRFTLFATRCCARSGRTVVLEVHQRSSLPTLVKV